MVSVVAAHEFSFLAAYRIFVPQPDINTLIFNCSYTIKVLTLAAVNTSEDNSVWRVKVLVAQSCPSLWLLCPWNSPGKITGVGYYAILQEIFPAQGSN